MCEWLLGFYWLGPASARWSDTPWIARRRPIQRAQPGCSSPGSNSGRIRTQPSSPHLEQQPPHRVGRIVGHRPTLSLMFLFVCSSRMSLASGSDRASRSSLVTIKVSPARQAARSRGNWANPASRASLTRRVVTCSMPHGDWSITALFCTRRASGRRHLSSRPAHLRQRTSVYLCLLPRPAHGLLTPRACSGFSRAIGPSLKTPRFGWPNPRRTCSGCGPGTLSRAWTHPD